MQRCFEEGGHRPVGETFTYARDGTGPLTSSFVQQCLKGSSDGIGRLVSKFLEGVKKLIVEKGLDDDRFGYLEIHPRMREFFSLFLAAMHIRLCFQVRPHEYCCLSQLTMPGGVQALSFRKGVREGGGFIRDSAFLRLWTRKHLAGSPTGIARDIDYHTLRMILVIMTVFGMPSTRQLEHMELHKMVDTQLASYGLVGETVGRVIGCYLMDILGRCAPKSIDGHSLPLEAINQLGARMMQHSSRMHGGTHYLQSSDAANDSRLESLQLCSRIRFNYLCFSLLD